MKGGNNTVAGISWVEFRAHCVDGQMCVVLINGETGEALQEDFARKCLVCPLMGYQITIDQVLKKYNEAHKAALTLVDTLRCAQGIPNGGGGG